MTSFHNTRAVRNQANHQVIHGDVHFYGEPTTSRGPQQRQARDTAMVEQIDDFSVHGPVGIHLNQAPYIDPALFVGRESELEQMSAVLLPGDHSPKPRRLVLGGMGGVGKTQLAITYTYRHRDYYTSALWLNATTQATVETDFQHIARRILSAPDTDGLSGEQAVAYVHRWLSHLQNTRWLLIFDNYDDPDSFDIKRFYPSISHGSVVVTTRLPDKVTGTQIRVRPLTVIDDGLDILQVRSGRHAVHTDDGARRLAERMAGLPLALATAGTYLRKTTLSFQQYLDLYERRWRVDRRQSPELQEYTDRTLYTTWNLSYSRLEADDAEAARMLQLLAYFDHHEIWYGLVQAGSSGSIPEWLRMCLTEQADFESIMGKLVECCFVEAQVTTGSYSVHGCVHDWTLGELNRDVDPTLYWYAFDCVARSSVDTSDYTKIGEVQYARVSHHGVRLAHHQFRSCYEAGLSTRLGASTWIAEMLAQQGQLSAAEQIYFRTLAEYKKLRGPDHADTLAIANNLARLYHTQGKLDTAEQMYRQALAGKEKVLGPDHTSTLTTIHNLGFLYKSQGKLDAAEQIYLQALAGYEKALGLDHAFTLTTINNLGLLYRRQGKLDAAEQMYRQALVGKEKVLGPSHTLTLTTVYNLGLLYQRQGRLDEAEQALQRAVLGREKMLGTSHASTIAANNALEKLQAEMAQESQE